MQQYVINYDANIYKCTARNFKDNKTSIGKIDLNGNFIPNSNYYNYFTTSYFENEICMNCELLPSCAGMCIQKKIENKISECPKNIIKETIINQLKLIIHKEYRQ